MQKLIAIACLFLLSFSSFSQVKTNFTKQNYSKFFKEDCIPKDLIADGHILLVETPYDVKDSAKTNEIDMLFKTYYKSPYIIVPLVMKDFRKTYENTKVYKYMVGISKDIVKYGDVTDKMNVGHTHYSLAIFDRVKLEKNAMPPMPEGLSKKEQQKFYKNYVKNRKDEDMDLTAMSSTGLEDNQVKLIDMLTFLAKKMGNYKE